MNINKFLMQKIVIEFKYLEFAIIGIINTTRYFDLNYVMNLKLYR